MEPTNQNLDEVLDLLVTAFVGAELEHDSRSDTLDKLDGIIAAALDGFACQACPDASITEVEQGHTGPTYLHFNCLHVDVAPTWYIGILNLQASLEHDPD